MKFTVLPLHLKAAYKAMGSVLLKNPTLPVLSNILVKPLSDTQLSFVASDGDNTVSVPLDVEDASGVEPFLLPSYNLGQFIANLGEWPVTFETDKKELCVSDVFGEFKFVIETDASAFPQMPEVTGLDAYPVPAASLIDTASVALHFVGNDDWRPQMNGVCFSFRKGQGLVIAASDSKRLFCDTVPGVTVSSDASVIVPKTVINAVTSLISAAGDAQVVVSFSDKIIRFQQDNIVIVGRLIEGKYPRFDAIIPKNNNRVAVLSRSMVISAVKRAVIAANATTGQIKLNFDGASSLQISARDLDFSTSASVRISTDSQVNLDGGLALGMRGSYLLDILSTLRSSDQVTVMMSDAVRAVLVKPSADSSRTMLIMPMQLVDF